MRFQNNPNFFDLFTECKIIELTIFNVCFGYLMRSVLPKREGFLTCETYLLNLTPQRLTMKNLAILTFGYRNAQKFGKIKGKE